MELNMRFSEDRIEKLTCSDGIQRDIHIWEHKKPRAVIICLHGLMDHGGNYLNLFQGAGLCPGSARSAGP